MINPTDCEARFFSSHFSSTFHFAPFLRLFRPTPLPKFIMSTAKKKSLLARIANLTDEEARDALNTMAMNLNTMKITVIKDLEDAIDHTSPAKEEEDRSKRKVKKERQETKKKGMKRPRAESDDSEVEPPPSPTHKEKEKKRPRPLATKPEASHGSSQNRSDDEPEIAATKQKRTRGQRSRLATNLDQPDDSPDDCPDEESPAPKPKKRAKQAESDASAVDPDQTDSKPSTSTSSKKKRKELDVPASLKETREERREREEREEREKKEKKENASKKKVSKSTSPPQCACSHEGEAAESGRVKKEKEKKKSKSKTTKPKGAPKEASRLHGQLETIAYTICKSPSKANDVHAPGREGASHGQAPHEGVGQTAASRPPHTPSAPPVACTSGNPRASGSGAQQQRPQQSLQQPSSARRLNQGQNHPGQDHHGQNRRQQHGQSQSVQHSSAQRWSQNGSGQKRGSRSVELDTPSRPAKRPRANQDGQLPLTPESSRPTSRQSVPRHIKFDDPVPSLYDIPVWNPGAGGSGGHPHGQPSQPAEPEMKTEPSAANNPQTLLSLPERLGKKNPPSRITSRFSPKTTRERLRGLAQLK